MVGALALVVWLRSRAITNDDPSPPSDWVQNARQEDIHLPQSSAIEIQSLLDQGKKIAAIKLVRQYAGVGLKEAKDYVDALESGKQSAYPGMQWDEPEEPAGFGETDLEEQVRNLLSAGRKIEAVKLVREQTGWGLKESKEFVDRLQ